MVLNRRVYYEHVKTSRFMAEYKKYECETCCFTVAANPKGDDVVHIGDRNDMY